MFAELRELLRSGAIRRHHRGQITLIRKQPESIIISQLDGIWQKGIRLCADANSDICGFPGWLAVRLQAVIIAACNLLCRKSVKRSA